MTLKEAKEDLNEGLISQEMYNMIADVAKTEVKYTLDTMWSNIYTYASLHHSDIACIVDYMFYKIYGFEKYLDK